ncbi:MAG: glycosyltransferase [Oscillospiraceae bacterium]|nr:glycosyltransferase [Oscillospiraceae bacterium]
MISIIIPVYNGEQHLERCVRSVLNQTYRKLEIILVNDGSTDGTADLCDRLATQDSRIRVIHQENGGVSAARNAGLDAATGRFIGFVDADDTISEDTYESAFQATSNCDMVMWDAVTVLPDGNTQPDTIDQLPESCLLSYKEITPHLLRYMAGAVWRCLYRAELLQDIRFPLGIKLSEDRLFNLQAMGKAENIQYLKRAMYYRLVREGSAVFSYHPDLWEKSQKAYDLAMKIVSHYWNRTFEPTYTKLFLVGGALAAIRQIASPAYPDKDRLQQIRAIAANPRLQEAFSRFPPQGLQETLLSKKAALPLRILYSIKH